MKKLIVTLFAGLTATAFYAQTITGSGTVNGIPRFTPNSTTLGNSGFFSNGTNGTIGSSTDFTMRFNVVTSSLNDGIRVLQTGPSSAALRLDNSSTGGRNWGILSTSNGNSQGGGKILFYDYSGGGLRMILDGSGNLGIGVNSTHSYNPRTRLHIHDGSLKFSGADQTGYGAPNIIFGGTPASAADGEWAIEYNSNLYGQGGGLNFWRPNNSHNGAGGTQTTVNNVLFLSNSNNVGIGTATPTGGRLHVYTNDGSGLCVEHNVTYDYDFGVKVRVNRDLTKAFSVINTTSGNEVMTVWGTGVINTPKLYAEEVQVVPVAGGNPWPDYVFAKNYSLMPLQDVEKFYTANNHLPGVPSQCEVEENGINVYQMNAVLLQKIEELTLYMVEQQKQIEALKAANNQTH